MLTRKEIPTDVCQLMPGKKICGCTRPSFIRSDDVDGAVSHEASNARGGGERRGRRAADKAAKARCDSAVSQILCSVAHLQRPIHSDVDKTEHVTMMSTCTYSNQAMRRCVDPFKN